MGAKSRQDASRCGARASFLVFLFIVLAILADKIAIVPGLVFLSLFVFFVQVIGDQIQMDGMDLRDLELGFALRTTQNLALFDFVFVDIDFGGTFRATNHGSTLRTVLALWEHENHAPTVQRIIYRGT